METLIGTILKWTLLSGQLVWQRAGKLPGHIHLGVTCRTNGTQTDGWTDNYQTYVWPVPLPDNKQLRNLFPIFHAKCRSNRYGNLVKKPVTQLLFYGTSMIDNLWGGNLELLYISISHAVPINYPKINLTSITIAHHSLISRLSHHQFIQKHSFNRSFLPTVYLSITYHANGCSCPQHMCEYLWQNCLFCIIHIFSFYLNIKH